MLNRYAPSVTFDFRDTLSVTLKGGKKQNQFVLERNEMGNSVGLIKGKKILVTGGLGKETYPNLKEPPKMPQLAVATSSDYTRAPIKKAAPKNIPALQTSSTTPRNNGPVSPRPQPVVTPKISPKPVPKIQPKPPSSSTPSTPGKPQAKALYDFEAENEDELAFKEGEIITVIDKSNNDWWEGEIGTRRGLFPGVYAQILDSARPKPAAKPPNKSTGKPQPKPPTSTGTRPQPGIIKNPGVPMPKFGPKK